MACPLQKNSVYQKSNSQEIEPEKSQKHEKRGRKNVDQEVIEQLEEISEILEHPDPKRDLDLYGKSSKIKPKTTEQPIALKAQ